MAGGFIIKKKNILSFKDYLIKNFEKSKAALSKKINLYLDSIIAPSALNEDFYNEINYLSPFGSGNNEPKFVIEDIKIIRSSIVGDNHIKTVLMGKDGSVFNGFAMNAKNTALESILDIKNKKKFNIAGKINLNEWKGKKNIEFIIEDISIN